MDLLGNSWLEGRTCSGQLERLSPLQVGEVGWGDLVAPRPDFQGALYQFLIGLLQTAYAPLDVQQWRERYANPPSRETLEAAFKPYRQAFIFHRKVKTTGFQPVSFSATMRGWRASAWITDTAVIRSTRSSITLFG